MSEDKVLALILKTLQNITDESMFSLASDTELGQIVVSKKGTPEAEAALVQITVRRLLGQIDHLRSGGEL